MKVKLPNGTKTNEILYGIQFTDGVSAEFNDELLYRKLLKRGYLPIETAPIKKSKKRGKKDGNVQ